MDLASVAWVCGLVLGAVPLLLQLIWYWNDLFYAFSLRMRGSGDVGELPPGHMGLPFIGETIRFLWYYKFTRRPDDYLYSKINRYGEGEGIYRSHLFGSPSIIVCAPASNKFILQSSENFVIKWPRSDLLGTTALVSIEGKEHSRLKAFLVNAINQPKALKRIMQVVQPRVVSALQSWAEKGVIKASEETKQVTFENICMMFVSMKPGRSVNDLDKYFTGLVRGLRAFPLNFPGMAYYHARQCRKKLTSVFEAELEKRKQTEYVKTNDLMDGLMEITDADGRHLTDVEVVENIVSFVLGGYESTSLATMWALIYLSKSPEALQKLREENVAISQGKTGQFITMDDISKMKYTSKVVEETIRLANIAWVVFRRAEKDVEYRGYKIPKGWQVLIWLRQIHVDAKNFDDPLCFNPDRWNKPPKPGTNQAFGGGERICAGNMLARVQLAVFLHHLSLGYRWKMVNEDGKMVYLPHPRPADGALMEFRAI